MRFAAPLAIFYILLWASAYVPSKIGATAAPPMWFLVLRFLAAGLLIAAVALFLRRPFPRRASQWLVYAAVGVLANSAYLGLTYTAFNRGLGAGIGSIVASTNPLILALVAPRLLNEPLSWLKALGLALGFGGVVGVTLARAGSTSSRPSEVGLAFVGVVSNVASTILFKRAQGARPKAFVTTESGSRAPWQVFHRKFGRQAAFRRESQSAELPSSSDLLAINAIQLVAAGLSLIPVALQLEPSPAVQIGPELIASFVYLVAVLSVGASLLWFWLLSHGAASRVSAFYFLTPIFGLAFGALLLGESIGPGDIVGLVAVAVGILLVQRG